MRVHVRVIEQSGVQWMGSNWITYWHSHTHTYCEPGSEISIGVAREASSDYAFDKRSINPWSHCNGTNILCCGKAGHVKHVTMLIERLFMMSIKSSKRFDCSIYEMEIHQAFMWFATSTVLERTQGWLLCRLNPTHCKRSRWQMSFHDCDSNDKQRKRFSLAKLLPSTIELKPFDNKRDWSL